MKKGLMVLVALALCSGTALAQLPLAWMVGYGVLDHAASDLSGDYINANPNEGILKNYDVCWQLIYAGANQVADPIDLNNPGYVSGDDEVLATRLCTKDLTVPAGLDSYLGNVPGYEDNVFAYTLPSEKFNSTDFYYFYQRIYESQTPVVGTYYLETTPEAFQNKDIMVERIFVGSNNEGIQPTRQVTGGAVPEPATMSLLGLGALAMFLRRRK